MASSHQEPLQILVIGPTSSGKTLLVKSLEYFYENKKCWDMTNIPQHMPTVGVDITSLNLRKHKSKASVELKELGGQMSPIWQSYFKDCRGLIFVVDSSNPFQMAEATVELGRTFKNPDLSNCHILIVFTKSDIPNEKFNSTYFTNSMLLDYLMHERVTKLKNSTEVVVNCSALSCTNLHKVIQWIERLAFSW